MADVPQQLGGTDAGPGPRDYLETALAACTAITMQQFADREGIPLVSSDVKIRILNEGDINQIYREITLIGELLTDEQRESLFAIAEECPLHRFLTKGAEIQSRLNQPELYVGL